KKTFFFSLYSSPQYVLLVSFLPLHSLIPFFHGKTTPFSDLSIEGRGSKKTYVSLDHSTTRFVLADPKQSGFPVLCTIDRYFRHPVDQQRTTHPLLD
ncbi:hypothetical protein BDV32DRAFT_128260, partial [Aspergillus pseudonomiae]